MCWEISLALAPPLVCPPSDVERRAQCQGDESLATGVDYFNYSWSCGAELPVGSARAVARNITASAVGGTCSEVRTRNEE